MQSRHRQLKAVMVTCRAAAHLLAASILCGCGGETGGDPAIFGVSPDSAQVAQNQSLTFQAGSNLQIVSVQWQLREGSAAGAIAPFTNQGGFFATYTAPNTPGTYHIDADITVSTNETGRATAIVTVP